MQATTSATSTKSSAWKRNLRRGAAATVALAALAGIPSPAHAGFSGANGKIAFVSNRDGNHEIYVMNANGTDQKRLTSNAGHDGRPAWSPDGKLIAFSSFRAGETEATDIFVMNADGTGVKQLTNSPGHDSSPSWSPTGQIIFSSAREDNDPDDTLLDYDLYTMNPDGTNQAPLPINDASGLAEETNAAFSSDGKYLSYTRFDTSKQSRVVVVDASFSSVWLPTEGPQDLDANWSPKPAPAGGYP